MGHVYVFLVSLVYSCVALGGLDIHEGHLAVFSHSLPEDVALVVADIYAEYFGVETTFVPEGVLIRSVRRSRSVSEAVCTLSARRAVSIDFVNTPDLYPAIAMTCERLGITLHATGTERLRYKESDRLEAVRLHEVRNDHRIAMALMAADYPVSQDEQRCIAKSYPAFVAELCGV